MTRRVGHGRLLRAFEGQGVGHDTCGVTGGFQGKEAPGGMTFDEVLDGLVRGVSRAVVTELRPLLTNSDVRQTDAKSDHLLTAADVAKRLNVGRRFVYDHADKWPFTVRLDEGTLRFSERGLDRWLEHRRP